MKYLLIIAFSIVFSSCDAQQQAYDIFSFKAPKGWKKTSIDNAVSYSITDKTTGAWALINVVKSTVSKGSADADFKNEWKDLLMTPYNVNETPLATDTQTNNGWKINSGIGQVIMDGDTASVILATYSDAERCGSVIMMTNSMQHGEAFDRFLASITLPKAGSLKDKSSITERDPQTTTGTKNNTANSVFADGFQFNTTNFDDGWTSVVKTDWVEATKGNIKVLIHYPRAEDAKYYPQYDERLSVFWNLLIAPRYSNMRNYEAPGNNDFEPAYFAGALLRDNETGRDQWVTLFNKGKSNWVEIITPDRNTFVREFGIDKPDRYFSEWGSLTRLAGMNRFAIGDNDLAGKWSNDFTGSTSYYNTYTGLYSGYTSFSSRENFQFNKNKTYNWDLVMGSGGSGTLMKVDQAKASGTWKVISNWQIWLSNIEKQAKTYNAYFQCIKGARILWLQDVSYGGYTSYGKISN